ncbi:MAG: TOBE domain-containing protein [Aminivibrio sp.]|jgi:molybdopterin-binding protein
MRLSARNQLRGKVTAIKEGAVEAQVTLDIGGGHTVVSVVTMDSVKNLGIAVGGEAIAVIKADSVMLAVD